MNSLHWRRKLHAFLHDSPDKAAAIAGHENRAALLAQLDKFGKDELFEKRADWLASAADRLPFPKWTELAEKLDDVPEFHHPLGGASIPKGKDFASTDGAFEISQKTRPFLLNSEDPRAGFICAWRFWRNWASEADPRFAFLPADTRIPDHTIWHHLAVTSALQGSLASPEQKAKFTGEDLRPRLLLFSIGPVQDFISAARSTRDLWSGSYLLSHLISVALGRIALDVGPDHVLFPNLLDQPLVDQRLTEHVYSQVSFDGSSIAGQLAMDPDHLQKLLTPSLPNRFLALLPARLPDDDLTLENYVAHLVQDLQDQLSTYAERIADFLDEHPHSGIDFDRERFQLQTERLLDVHWQLLPVPDTFQEVYSEKGDSLAGLLPQDAKEKNEADVYAPRQPIKAMVDMTGKCPPQYDLHPTSAWGILNAAIAWLHDGAKSLRHFDGWREGRWDSGRAEEKDSLNGKEEAVLRLMTGSQQDLKEWEWKEKLEAWCAKQLGMSRGTFKSGEKLGASTLIKRLWHEVCLPGEFEIRADDLRKAMPMPNTRSIAAGKPFAQDRDEDGKAMDEDDGTAGSSEEKYFAVLALDGDEMGKWISGSKSPTVAHGLSPKAEQYYKKHCPEFLEARRAVTPSWHLQFSEALGTFGLHAARRVVESFNGRLIYAGGDDVLAMLPATEALACARALRAAFRGETALNSQALGVLKGTGEQRRSDRTTPLFAVDHPGYLKLHPDSGAAHGDQAGLLSDPVRFHALLPGPATDVSVGIAIAHHKAPLQDVVRAAQTAEKRAKRSQDQGGFGRAAVAISLFKRSGEILEWGCKWANPNADSAGYRLLHALVDALIGRGESDNRLNARFPHKLEALLLPYLPDSSSIASDSEFEKSFEDVLALELDHCLQRNEGGKLDDGTRALFASYWQELGDRSFAERLRLFLNLLRTAAWMSRSAGKNDKASPQPA